MSEALQLYLALKAKTKDKRFTAYANRAVNYLFAAVGDKHLPSYTRADANTLRDFLIKKGWLTQASNVTLRWYEPFSI